MVGNLLDYDIAPSSPGPMTGVVQVLYWNPSLQHRAQCLAGAGTMCLFYTGETGFQTYLTYRVRF